jgi:FkbM family methyltransferase
LLGNKWSLFYEQTVSFAKIMNITLSKIILNSASRNIVKGIARLLNRYFSLKKGISFNINNHKIYAKSWDRIAALCLRKFNLLDTAQLEILEKIVKDGMVVVEFGGNTGFHSLQLAKLVGSKGKVYVFEPDPENYSLLLQNIKANHYNNIFPNNLAVSDKTTKTRLYVCEEHKGDHRMYKTRDKRKTIEIESVALDDFFNDEDKIDFIKMDIQGWEHRALLGMKKLINKNDNIKIICEYAPAWIRASGNTEKQLINEFLKFGFTLKYINEEKGCLEEISLKGLNEICTGNEFLDLFLERPKQ